MSWFRSSLRRRSREPVGAPAAPPAEEPPPAEPPRPAAVDLAQRPLADLHALAAEWKVPRYRVLRRPQLIAAISGEEPPAEPAVEAVAAEPEPVVEREPVDEPEPVVEAEPAGTEDAEVQAGFVDLVGDGYGFLRVHGLSRSRDDPYLSRTLVREHSLRRGDEISGPVMPRRSGDRHRRMVDVEWRRGGTVERDFDDLPVQRPARAMRPQPGADAFSLRMAELVSTLAFGQRALVAGPPGAGATHLLREVARGVLGGNERLIVILVDVRPEEVAEWAISEQVEVHAAPADRPPREQVALAELVLERAKRLAERGEDVVVLLDSISRLARAYGVARARAGEDGPTPELLATEGAKRWFAGARETGAGSLTLLATARVDSDSPLEALLHETLLDMAGAVIRLDAELAAQGKHPAIDAGRSQARGEEALLDEGERHRLESLRGVMRSLPPAEAWEFAAARVRETRSIAELLRG